ncbi:hypothetical protein DBR39_12785 [Chryseobacterium sp. KBW03]|uniref:hypothetical protein n=1 Tax=Bacteroidota TaxID=976 RepID=UPI000F590930|nr:MULTISPECIES: hypothetical protein [Bacteroidota]RQO37760.1 hypothetical protein DBR39_12785 [Chryseobacterium sp. KBW03]
MKRIDFSRVMLCAFLLGSNLVLSELVSIEEENASQVDLKCLHPPELQFANILVLYCGMNNKIGVNIFQPIKDHYQTSNIVTLLKKNPFT